MAGNPALNFMVHQVIYDLKKRFGAPIQVYRLTASNTDYETGVKTATKESFDIRKAAVLPADEIRRFVRSLSFISQSKAFVSPGGQGWDQSTRGFVIDWRDIQNFDFQMEDWIVYRDKRYEISMVERLEYDTGWFVVGIELKGQVPERNINVNVVETFILEDEEQDEL